MGGAKPEEGGSEPGCAGPRSLICHRHIILGILLGGIIGPAAHHPLGAPLGGTSRTTRARTTNRTPHTSADPDKLVGGSRQTNPQRGGSNYAIDVFNA